VGRLQQALGASLYGMRPMEGVRRVETRMGAQDDGPARMAFDEVRDVVDSPVDRDPPPVDRVVVTSELAGGDCSPGTGSRAVSTRVYLDRALPLSAC